MLVDRNNQRSQFRNTLRTLSVLIPAAAIAVPTAAPAATFTWTGGGTDNNWKTPENWGGTTTADRPDDRNSDVLSYANTPARTTSNNNIQNLNDMNSMRFEASLMTSMTITGQSIRMNGTGVDFVQDSTFAQTINNSVETSGDLSVGGTGTGSLTFNGNQTITGQNARTATINGGFNVTYNGNFALGLNRAWDVVKDGTGLLTLAGTGIGSERSNDRGDLTVNNGGVNVASTGIVTATNVLITGGSLNGSGTFQFNINDTGNNNNQNDLGFDLNAGTLDVSGLTLNINNLGTLAAPSYLVVDYAGGGTFLTSNNASTDNTFGAVVNLPSGYELFNNTSTNQVVLRQQQSVPEPAMLTAAGVGMLLLLRRRRA